MKPAALKVKFCLYRAGARLAVIDLPVLDAEMYPRELRALADALRRVADTAENIEVASLPWRGEVLL